MSETEKENLTKHVKELCTCLNKNGYVQYFSTGGIKGLWKVNKENPSDTLREEICKDEKAFLFLKSNNRIDIDICWNCGEVSGTETYIYSGNIEFPICTSCSRSFDLKAVAQRAIYAGKWYAKIQRSDPPKSFVNIYKNKSSEEPQYLKWISVVIGVIIIVYWMFG